MQSVPLPLIVRRTTNCAPNGAPQIHVLLISDECPVLDYAAASLADAVRYEQETLTSLKDCHCDLQIIMDDVSDCPQCLRHNYCLSVKQAQV